MDFDCPNNGEWESVMFAEKLRKNVAEEGEDDAAEQHDEAESDDDEDRMQKVDMPPPWSPPLVINKDQQLDLYPKGEKTIFYKKVTVEYYSECK